MSGPGTEAADASAAVESVAGVCPKQASGDMAAAATSPRAACSTHSHAATSDNSAMTDTAVHSPGPLTPFHDGLVSQQQHQQQQHQQQAPLEHTLATGASPSSSPTAAAAAAAAAGVCSDSSLERPHSQAGPEAPAMPPTAVKLMLQHLAPPHSAGCDAAAAPSPPGSAAAAAAAAAASAAAADAASAAAADAASAAAADAASDPPPQLSTSSWEEGSSMSAGPLLAAAQVVAGAQLGSNCPQEPQVRPLTDEVVQNLLRKGVTQLLQRAASAKAAAAEEAAAKRAQMPPPPPRPAHQQRALQRAEDHQQQQQVREGTRAVDEWLQQLKQQQQQQQQAAAAAASRSLAQPDTAAAQLLAELQEFWQRTGCVPVACGTLQGLLELSPSGQYRVTFAHQGRAVTHDMAGFMSAAGLLPSTEWMDAVTLLEVSQPRGGHRAAPCRPITVREAIKAWAAEVVEGAAPAAGGDLCSQAGAPAAAAAAGGVHLDGVGSTYGRGPSAPGAHFTQGPPRWGAGEESPHNRGWVEGARAWRRLAEGPWQKASEWADGRGRQTHPSRNPYMEGPGAGMAYRDAVQEQEAADPFGPRDRSRSPQATRRGNWKERQRLERIRRLYLDSDSEEEEPQQRPPWRRKPAPAYMQPQQRQLKRKPAAVDPTARMNRSRVDGARPGHHLSRRSSDTTSGDSLDKEQDARAGGASSGDHKRPATSGAAAAAAAAAAAGAGQPHGGSEGQVSAQQSVAEQQDPAAQGTGRQAVPKGQEGSPSAAAAGGRSLRERGGLVKRRVAQAGAAGRSAPRSAFRGVRPAPAAPPAPPALDLEGLAAAWVRQRLRWRGPIDAVLAQAARQRWADFQQKLVEACRAQLQAKQEQLLQQQAQEEEQKEQEATQELPAEAAAAEETPATCGAPKAPAMGGVKSGRSYEGAEEEAAGVPMRPAKRLALVVLRPQEAVAHSTKSA